MAECDFELVAQLVAGRSTEPELVFRGGTAVPPIAVGTRGGWRVLGAHVAPVHLTLAFNGARLFVSSRAPAPPRVAGRAIGASWIEVRATTEIAFGSARVVVRRRRVRSSNPRNDAPTVAMELAARAALLARGLDARPPQADATTVIVDEESTVTATVSFMDLARAGGG